MLFRSQKFLMNFFDSNKMNNSLIRTFIMQDLTKLIKNLPSGVKSFMKFSTDIVAKTKNYIGFGTNIYEQRKKNQRAQKITDIIEIDQHNCWNFLKTFDKWDQVSLIIHQGAISSTVETNINKIHRYNVEYTLELFSYAIRYGIPVKYASSASVYGNTEGQINPLNYYAISKLQIDYYVQDNLDKFSFIQGFRYFNVYGNHEDNKGDQSSPVSKFTKQIKETGKLRLFEGSDKFFRDFICVDDLVEVVLKIGRAHV